MQCAIAVRCGRWDQLLAMTEPQAQTPALKACPVENHSWQIYRIASDILAARIAALSGDKAGAISLLRDAVANQDQLLYDEPADWYYPVRENLGGMLLQTGDAKGKIPRSPRSLFGLSEALTRQRRDYDASWVKQQFETAWQGADVTLKAEDL